MEINKDIPETVKYKTQRLYKESFKVSVITDLLRHDQPDSYIARKHGLSSGFMSTLKKDLLERYGYFRILEAMRKQDQSEKDLAAENARLKKALELSVLKVAALETLIDVAEDQFNIDIRKKPEPRQ